MTQNVGSTGASTAQRRAQPSLGAQEGLPLHMSRVTRRQPGDMRGEG